MKHPINPLVDCVFKKLLGSEENRDLTCHFLNAVFVDSLTVPLAEVTLLNPYNEKSALDDKLSIVDVKARDEAGRTFQIEVQLSTRGGLPQRMLYNWAQLYVDQLGSGGAYLSLKPVLSVWILDGALPGIPSAPHHRFHIGLGLNSMYLDRECMIHALELPAWQTRQVGSEIERWIRFLREGAGLDPEHLPPWMNTGEMHKAMEVLVEFSEREKALDLYRRRQDYRRVIAGYELDLEEAKEAKAQALAAKEGERAAKEQALAAKEAERAAKEQALAEVEALRARLRAAGLEEG